MKHKKSVICAVVAFLVLATVFGMGSSTTVAKELTSDSIKEKEEQIKAAEEEKKELQNGLTDLKKIKESLEKSKNDLTKYVAELDANLVSIENKIAELKGVSADEVEQATTENTIRLFNLPINV